MYASRAAGPAPLTARASLAPLPALVPLPGEHFAWSDVRTPLVVIVFLAPDCPFCQRYSVTLNALEAQYHGSVTFIGVFPGRGYADRDYIGYRDKYHIRFALTKDPAKVLALRLRASVTPEAFLLDARRTVLYHGAIDDMAVGLGKTRLQPTQPYLQQAIADAQAGRPLAIDYREAVGCWIN